MNTAGLLEEALALAAALGGAGEEDLERLRPLCESALGELSARLRPEVAAEDCPALPLAAAWTALADLWAGERAGGAASFSAGDLTIRMGERGEAGNLRRRALELLRPYARDEGFCFRGVEGL